MAETKSELKQIAENLRSERTWHRTESDSLRRLVVDLVKEERTLKLRFQWLEEAATEVVTSCPKHRPGMIERLADELGIELNQEK